MKFYQLSNVEMTDQFITANVYKDDKYMMKVGAEILHLEYTRDIKDILYKEFSEFALNYLNICVIKESKSANVIKIWDFVKKTCILKTFVIVTA